MALSHRTYTPPTPFTVKLIAVCLLLAVLWWGRPFLAPLCLAGFVALTLNPLVTRLSRALPRSLAAALVVFSLVGIVGGATYTMSDEIAEAVEGLPSAARQLRTTLQASARGGVLTSIDRAIAEVERLWGEPATPSAGGAMDLRRTLLATAGRAGSVMTQAVAMVFLIFFLLASGEELKLKLVRLSGERLSSRRITLQAIDQVVSRIGQFVVYLMGSGLMVGLATWAAFAWMGIAYASLWGLAAGLLNSVPYLGPTFIMVGSFVAALVQFQSPGMALAASGASLAITSIEGLVLAPLLFGSVAQIHPVAIFLSIMFWSWLWGPIGTFLAVPIVTAVKAVVDLLPDAAPASEMLAPADDKKNSGDKKNGEARKAETKADGAQT